MSGKCAKSPKTRGGKVGANERAYAWVGDAWVAVTGKQHLARLEKTHGRIKLLVRPDTNTSVPSSAGIEAGDRTLYTKHLSNTALHAAHHEYLSTAAPAYQQLYIYFDNETAQGIGETVRQGIASNDISELYSNQTVKRIASHMVRAQSVSGSHLSAGQLVTSVGSIAKHWGTEWPEAYDILTRSLADPTGLIPAGSTPNNNVAKAGSAQSLQTADWDALISAAQGVPNPKPPRVNLDTTIGSGTYADVIGCTNSWCLSRTGQRTEVADAVILSDRPGLGLCVLLIRRVHPPFAGVWSLPGGLHDADDVDLSVTADREMLEEVGVPASAALARHVLGGAIESNTWDPRFIGVRAGGVAYLVDAELSVTAGDDAASAQWLPIDEVASGAQVLAFEHAQWLARTFKEGSPMQDRARSTQFSLLAAAAQARNATLIDKVNAIRASAGAAAIEYDMNAVQLAHDVLGRYAKTQGTGLAPGPILDGRARDTLVAETAARLHDAWRAPRALSEGGFEPRVKPDGAGGEVDIANTNYKDLPEKWQADNRAAATSVVDQLLANPSADIETLADLVHKDWLSRNGEWAEPGQKLPYAELSEEEKQKDREVVLAARAAIA